MTPWPYRARGILIDALLLWCVVLAVVLALL